MLRAAAVVVVLALSTTGCATPLRGILRDDLLAAQANFDVARMPTESRCIQAVIDKMAAEEAADYSVRGVASAGSVAYIAYAKLAGTQSGGGISEQCYAVIGKITTAVGKRAVGAMVP